MKLTISKKVWRPSVSVKNYATRGGVDFGPYWKQKKKKKTTFNKFAECREKICQSVNGVMKKHGCLKT